MAVNIIIGALLSLLTFFLTYAAMHIIVRRIRARRSTQQKKEQSEQDASVKYVNKYSKEAYCYPTINDVMGYDFVTVEGVTESIETRDPKKEKDDAWQRESRRAGFTTVSESEDEDEPAIEGETSETRTHKEIEVNDAETNGDELEEEELVETLPAEFSTIPEELKKFEGQWTILDESEQKAEEDWERNIQGNEDIIVKPDFTRGVDKTAAEQVAFQEMLNFEKAYEEEGQKPLDEKLVDMISDIDSQENKTKKELKQNN